MPTTIEHLNLRALRLACAYLLVLDADLDATAAIQSALDKGVGEVAIPPGTYRVDGTIVVPASTNLNLEGVLLKRHADAVSTEPILHLKYSRATVTGGCLLSEKNHPNGIIVVGHLDITSTWNSDNCKVNSPAIRGVQASGNVAIKVMSSQPVLGDNYSSYFHTITTPDIRGCDIGILFTEKANGCDVIAPHFWDCITAAVCFRGAYANTLLGGFLHTSTNGVVGVLFQNHAGQTYSTHHSDGNIVSGFKVEPGGAASKGVHIENLCENNFIEILGNCAGGNTILNANNTVFSRYGKHQFAKDRTVDITTLEHRGRSSGLTNVTNQGNGTCAENVTVPLADITLGTRKSVLVDVEVICTNASLDNPTVLRRQFAVKNQGGNFTFTTLDGQTDGNGLTISWSTPSAGVARLAVTTFNNGTATTYAYGWSVRVRGSTLPSVVWP